mmetsp:Transcript_2673/g.3790  ORF Transcript_2673/g.3790 Transcript_2673/m.3790 type:complete len:249 (+) Transcript_2673:1481-2227(+)
MESWTNDSYGQFCGKEDKEKFEIDQKGSGSGNESNFGRNLDAEANLISQCLASSPSNIMNMDHVTMALSLPPGAAASVGGASAGGQRTTSTGSLYDSHVYIKAEPGGKAQTGKRAAASQGGPQKKAPRLDIPETGLMCLPTTNLSNISDGSPGSLVAALSANQGGSGDGSPSQLSLQIPLDPTSSSSGLLADHFLTTPTSTLYHNPISPLGDAGQLTWPDSRSPASSVNAAKSAGPNAFPDPKVKGKG